MGPSIDPADWSYTDYVCFLRSHGFHNLSVVDEYLQWGLSGRNTAQVRHPEAARSMLLEFSNNSTRLSDMTDIRKLRLLLAEWMRPTSAPKSPGSGVIGRTILIENINPALVDTIGGALNIDPTFFATHLDDTSLFEANSAHIPTPRSQSQQDFYSIEYLSAFTPLGCPKDSEGVALYSRGNYSRRIELIQKQGKQKVALARRKISFFIKKTDPWLSIILVDPPVSEFSMGHQDFNAIAPTQHFHVVPYQGGYLDFIEMRKPLDKRFHDFRDCRHRAQSPSAFDDLLRHFQVQARDGLFSGPLVPSTYMRPCFQIAASSTSNTFTYLSHILANISSQNCAALHPDPARIKRILLHITTIDTLLSNYKQLLASTKDYAASTPDLQASFRNLLSTLYQHRSTCDTSITHLNTLLSTLELSSLHSLTSEAMRKSDYLRYLTIIALIYAPFAIACAVFTMPHDFAPAGHYLYAFLPVTAVITILLMLLVLPESRDAGSSLRDVICGGLTRKKLLGKRDKDLRPNSRGSSSKKSAAAVWDEV